MSFMSSTIFSYILYPDSSEYDFDIQLMNCINFVNSKGGKYAYCLHDKDVHIVEHDNYRVGDIKKAHVHFVCKFPNAISFNSFCENCKVTNKKHLEILHSFEAGVRYLIHIDHSEKAQYPLSSVFSNFNLDIYFKDLNLKTSQVDETSAIRDIINFISCNQLKCFDDVLYFALDNGYYSQFRRSYKIIQDFYTRNKIKRGHD